ncbi:MAG: ATP-dependent sacrificial sulfur transferase LarE [Pirellulales bacterium]
MSTPAEELALKRDRLLAALSSYGSCVVAYTGGVDSAVVAKAAQIALGNHAVAVTGVSASLAEGELESAAALAREIGIRHLPLNTDELSSAAYTANAPNRCFHCKTELYTQLTSLADSLGVKHVASGTNLDDLGDYRPGLAAAASYGVRQPLVDCGIAKADVRALAAAWQLPVAEKPASPCLSSRIAYGQSVTPERLRMIDRAEQSIRALGINVCRVRYREGDVASIEVPLEAIERLEQPRLLGALREEFLRLGFREVVIDPAGFRSGSLNESLPLHQIQPLAIK